MIIKEDHYYEIEQTHTSVWSTSLKKSFFHFSQINEINVITNKEDSKRHERWSRDTGNTKNGSEKQPCTRCRSFRLLYAGAKGTRCPKEAHLCGVLTWNRIHTL